MRIRLTAENGTQITFPSWKMAMENLKMTKRQIEKKYAVVRLYERGYWNDVDKGWLKEVGRRHKDVGYCLIE